MGTCGNNILNVENECNTKCVDPIPESIKDKLYKSIVKIELINITNKRIYATGFFMRIKIYNKEKKCLFSCKHIISDKDINNNIIINLYFDENNKEEERKIKLDKNQRFIKTFNEDVILIEIIKDDNISEDKYLTPDLNYEYGYNNFKDKNLYLAGHLRNYNDKYISSGRIIKISGPSFEHKLNTKEVFSGSSICNENGDVIGIHISGDKKEI